MAYKGKEFNKLGKPISRTNNGKFAKGNQEGKHFPKGHTGRPSGTKNLMTVIKEYANMKSHRDGLTNFQFIQHSLQENQRRIMRILDKMEEEGKEDTPEYRRWLDRSQELTSKLSEHLAKYSGDYKEKMTIEPPEELSDEEKEIMEQMLKTNK